MIDIPWYLPGTPLLAQVDAMEKMAKIERARGVASGAIFADPGLGKTWAAFNLILHRFKKGQAKNAIICVPSYLVSNWENEAKIVGFDQEVAFVPYGLPTKDLHKWAVNVTYYQRLLTDDFDYHMDRVRHKSAVVIWDESQSIKNFTAKTTKQAMMLSKESPYVYPMSGTPMEKVTDYWPQLRIAKGISGINPIEFRNRFAKMGGYKGKEVVGIRNEEQLRTILEGCAFEAAEEDYWKDAPPKSWTVINHELTPKQKELYRQMEIERLITLDESEVSAAMVITMMNKLQQIACGFVFDDQRRAHQIMPDDQNPRIKALKAKLEATPTKTYVVCVHRPVMDQLRRVFPEAAYMYSGMEPSEQQDQKNRFNGDPTCRLMLAPESIGKAGHTLIGEAGPNRCRTMIFYQNEYSIITRQQAEKRPHRQGQDMPVEYCDIVATKEDARVIKALQRKKDIVRAALGRE